MKNIKNKWNLLEFEGVESPSCQEAIDSSLDALYKRLPKDVFKALQGVRVIIGDNLITSGAQAYEETRTIILDKSKNAMSLREAENFLVRVEVLNKGEWTEVLPDLIDKPWSCLTYQLVHEIGHILGGGMNPSLSPTRYGKTNKYEAFAEGFAYWVFCCSQKASADKEVVKYLSSGRNWIELKEMHTDKNSRKKMWRNPKALL